MVPAGAGGHCGQWVAGGHSIHRLRVCPHMLGASRTMGRKKTASLLLRLDAKHRYKIIILIIVMRLHNYY